MRKQTALILSCTLTLGFFIFLFVNARFFMPADGWAVKTRPVPESEILISNDENSKTLRTGEMIDLNQADFDTLQKLEGIGPILAQAILDYREEHNGFQTVDELLEVPGIGEKKFNTIQEHVIIK